MTGKRTIIERGTFYKEVWEESLAKLAPKYGISNVALKKISKKLNVPTPPRGYWAKLEWVINDNFHNRREKDSP